MEQFRELSYKWRMGIVLVAILAAVLLNNLYSRSNVTDLDHTISAIYKDRLMPATYIFRITDHLYQKRILLQHNSGKQLYAPHDHAIASLIQEYEATHLTREETRCWQSFRQHLDQYDNVLATSGNTPAEAQQFAAIIKDLNALSEIQAGEGSHLHASSVSLLNNTSLGASLEMVLVVLLGLFSLALLGIAQKNVFRQPQRPSLN